MDVRRHRRDGKDLPTEVQPRGSLSLEPLEPRILLNADLLGTKPSLLDTSPSDYAIEVDLGLQRQQAVASDPSLMLSYLGSASADAEDSVASEATTEDHHRTASDELLMAAPLVEQDAATMPDPVATSLHHSQSDVTLALTSSQDSLSDGAYGLALSLLSFEPNQGQAGGSAAFISRGPDYTLYLGPQEVSLRLTEVSAASPAGPFTVATEASSASGGPSTTVGMRWVGGDPDAFVAGVDQQSHVSHYFTGSDPSAWLTDVPNFAQVRCVDVYPGIDLIYYGRTGELEYDWVVEPGADPGRIVMTFSGVDSLQPDASGQLVLSTAAGDVIHRAPELYQTIDGQRVQIAGSFQIFEDQTVGFEVGSYDPTRALVIDPQVLYTTWIGGSLFDETYGVAVDAEGNAYVVGQTDSLDFPIVGNAIQPEKQGQPGPNVAGADAFIAKFNAAGTLEWSTYLGGDSFDRASGVAFGADGSIYVGGTTRSIDFPTWFALQPTLSGPQGDDNDRYIDAWMAKLTPDGSALFYSTYLGGPTADGATDLAVDAAGSAYLVGGTSGGFPVQDSLYSYRGGAEGWAFNGDAFLTKFAPDGQSLVFSTFLGGTAGDAAHGIALDESGNMYVAGDTSSVIDFPMVNPLVLPVGTNNQDTFVTKISADGSEVLYSTRLGGSTGDPNTQLEGEWLHDIAVDASGVIAVVGSTGSANFPTTANALKPASADLGVLEGTNHNITDAFLSVVDPSLSGGDALVYSTFLGGDNGSESQYSSAVTFDPIGDIYVAGSTGANDFPVTDDAIQPFFAGGFDPDGDVFLVKINRFKEGAESLVYGSYYGGGGMDTASDVAVTDYGHVFIAGRTGTPFVNESFDGWVARFEISPSRGAVGTSGTQVRLLEEFAGQVGTFTTRRQGAVDADFEATIYWGDGTDSSDTGIIPLGDQFVINGQHTYEYPGAFPVLANVTDTAEGGIPPARVINISQMPGHQVTPAVAVDPSNPSRVFVVGADEDSTTGTAPLGGLVTAVSDDGGLTWQRRTIAQYGSETMPAAVGYNFDAAFDVYGNLFLAYVSFDGSEIIMARSSDGGVTFDPSPPMIGGAGSGSENFNAVSLATGPGAVSGVGSVWLTYCDSVVGEIYLVGADVAGLGAVGSIGTPALIVAGEDGKTVQLPDVAVGPDGQVMVVWQEDEEATLTSRIMARVDMDGTDDDPPGLLLARPVVTAAEFMEYSRMYPSVAWDRSGGEYDSQVYVAYQEIGWTTEEPFTSMGLDIFVVRSTDEGVSWSDPVRVNDDFTDHRQSGLALALDQTDGNIAVGWYDARYDASDTEMQYFLAASNDGGESFVANVALAPMGITAPEPAYLQSDLVFCNGTVHAVWSDNGYVADLRDTSGLEIALSVVGIMDVPIAPVGIRPAGFYAVENTTYSGLVASFTHPDDQRTADEFLATILWGDGAESAGSITQAGGPGTPFLVTGSHTYQDEGGYPVVVTIFDSLTERTWYPTSNVSHWPGSQSEGTIAIDPSDPNRVFAAVNQLADDGGGVLVASSTDGGVTWDSRIIGDGTDGLPELLGDPKATFDRFGNLYFVVLGTDRNTRVLHSTDGGATLSVLETFVHGDYTDQPSVATGPGQGGAGDAVWITYQLDASNDTQVIVAQGASVSGLGSVGAFTGYRVAPALDDGTLRNFGDIEIGPDGQVMVVYQTPSEDGQSTLIVAHVDPDGLGPAAFALAVTITETADVGAYPIPAQEDRPVTMEGNLAWDRSGGPRDGRVYLTYTDTAGGMLDPDTNIFLRYSDDDGQTWSDPVVVSNAPGSQYLPAVAINQDTGNLAVAFHSTAADPNNILAEYVATVSGDGGETFTALQVISQGASDAMKPGLDTGGKRLQLGDYTEMTFFDGVFQSVWTDNSWELPDNPDTVNFDLANGRVGVANVLGVPLSVSATDFSAVEDEEFTRVVARFQDPDDDMIWVGDYAATIDWGDGTGDDEDVTIELVSGVLFSVTASHEYEQKGSYPVTITVWGRKTEHVVTVTATVDDAPLTPTGLQIRVVEQVPFTETVARFTDGNTNSTPADFTAQIDWGDSTVTAGTIVFVGTAGDENVYAVIGSHTYQSETTFQANTTISEIGGATVVATSDIIAGDPPMVPLWTVNNPAEIGALEGVPTGLLTLGQFQIQQGPIDTEPGAYLAEVDWDDGTVTPAPVVLDGDFITIQAEHTYADGGTYFPTIIVSDDSGGSAIGFAIATVARDMTDPLTVIATGLVYNPSTQTFTGGIGVYNATGSNVTGPFRIVFDELSPGTVLQNADDSTIEGDPYLKEGTGILFAGATLPSVPMVFTAPDPQSATILYTPKVYAGAAFLGSSLDPMTQLQSLGLPVLADGPTADGLLFEPNVGQTDPSVQYLARGPGYAVFLTAQEVVLRLDGSEAPDGAVPVVRMQWLGGQADPRLFALGRQASTSNYLIGDDATQWLTDVPTFRTVRYDEVYPGIDLVLYGSDGEMEYDWVLAPGANPQQIRLAFAGADNVAIDGEGRLQLTVASATVVHRAPNVYQYADGALVTIDGRYVVHDDGSVGFEVGAYDPARTLVIDPVLVYASYLGGSDEEAGIDVEVDAAGNVYVVGQTVSVDFPTFNAMQSEFDDVTSLFMGDVFLTKLDDDGQLVYSTYLGSPGRETPTGMTLDGDRNVYIVGFTDSHEFPTVNAFQPDFGGTTIFYGGDGFVMKLDPTGTDLIYSSYLGGTSDDSVIDVAVDDAGAAYVVGYTYSRWFPVTSGAYQFYHSDPANLYGEADESDAFVAKIAPDGLSLEYATFLGGYGRDNARKVRVDDDGNAHLAGSTHAADFPTPGGFDTSHGGLLDAFVATVNPDGSDLLYGTYLGGGSDDWVTGFVLDDAGRAYVVGTTESGDFPSINALQAHAGGRDAFLAVVDSDGSLAQATCLGTDGTDEGAAVALDNAGNIIVAGSTSSSAFPVGRAVQPYYGGGDSDGFLAVIEPSAPALVYSTFVGGSEADSLRDVAVGAGDHVYAVGTTLSSDLRTVDATQPRIGTGTFPRNDAMLVRIAPTGTGTIVVANQPIQATEGTAFDGLVATFTDTDDDQAGDYAATIDWGDGATDAGIVEAAGNGRFNVFGSHVYQTFGSYGVAVTIQQSDGSTAAATGIPLPSDQADFADYRIAIDTSDLAGMNGYVSLQFNPATSSGAQAAEASLSDFDLGGGAVFLPAEADGGASGGLDALVSIHNVDQLNRLVQPVIFGDTLQFSVRLSGEAIANPSDGIFASSLAVQLLGDDAATPLLTDDPTGAVAAIDVLRDGTTRSATFADPSTGQSFARVAALTIALVEDAPLESQDVPIAVLEGVPFTEVVATFTDANPFGTADEFAAQIDWGDGGAPTAGVIAAQGPGSYAVEGSHVYADIGRYSLGVTITSVGGSGTAVASVSGVNGFQTSRPAFAGSSIAVLAHGDFDNDGNQDVVVPSGTSGSMGNRAIILFGEGNGAFTPAVSVAVGTGPYDVATGDFNGDGMLDFATANPSGNSVSAVLGNGDRTFQSAVDTTVTAANGIVAGDLDHDGDDDLLVTAFQCTGICFTSMTALVSNGDGTFSVLPSVTTIGSGEAHIHDLNADGHPDLVGVFGFSGEGTMTVALGNGDGSFQPATQTGAGVPRGSVDFGDVNGDAAPDMVVGGTDEISVLFGDGDGGFGMPVSYAAGGYNRVGLADMDGNGNLDVVSTVRGRPSVNPPTVGGTWILLNAGDGTFGSAVQYAAPARPEVFVVDDFNNDGFLDVVAGELVPFNSGRGTISVALGLGDGALAAPIRHELPDAGTLLVGARYVVAGDLDGDDVDDVVFTNIGSGGAGYPYSYVMSQLSNGDGTLAEPVKCLIAETPTALALADVNDDGLLDLVATDAPQEGISVLLGIGDGTFGTPHSHQFLYRPGYSNVPPHPKDVAVGDVNNDGHVDLVVVAGPSSCVLLGHGDGTFDAPEFFTNPSEVYPSTVDVGDFNSDGNLDVVVNQRYPGSVFSYGDPGRLSVMLGNGDGTFLPAVNYETVFGPASIVVSDVNGDGKLDVVSANASSDTELDTGSFSVMLGIGDGTFQAPVNYAPDQQYDTLVVADFDGDGRLDLAAAGGLGKQISNELQGFTVVYNHGDGTFGEPWRFEGGAIEVASVAAGDFDGDGLADIAVANESDNTLSIVLNRMDLSGATVTNAPLTAGVYDLNPVAGVAFTARTAWFEDANLFGQLGDYTAEIDWGDGQTSPGVIDENPEGGFLVTGSHTYQQQGAYDMIVRIMDDAGGTAEATGTADVGDSDFPIHASPVTFDAVTTVPWAGTVATFVDDDPNGSSADFSVLIQWGDGANSPGWITGDGALEVLGQHTYASPGDYGVQVTITDIGGSSDSVTSTALVSAMNQPPSFTSTPVVTAIEDEPYLYAVTATDDDIESLIISGTTLPTWLTLTDHGGGTATLMGTPMDGHVGDYVVVLTATDSGGLSVTQSFTVTVSAVNDAPTANDDAATTPEDVAVDIDVLANDTDVDGDPLVVDSVTQPANGTVTNNGIDVTYTPDANFHGVDSFTYTVSDGQGGTDTATVTVTVTPVNDAPVANDDVATTPEDVAVDIYVLANDSDIDGDMLVVDSVTQPTNGTVTNNGVDVTYTPDANYHGEESFIYTISDGQGGLATATVTVTVTPVNDTPVANDDTATTPEDTPVDIDVLANDTDIDGDTLTVTDVGDPANGTTAINPDGTVEYTPDPNYHGPDSFTYTVSDGNGGTDTAAVTVTVGAANDAPVAADDTATTPEGTAVTIPVLANDTDVDGDSLSVSDVSDPENGTAVINPDNTVTYTPAAGFHGLDSFVYTVSDGQGDTASATVTVTVKPSGVGSSGILGMVWEDFNDDGLIGFGEKALAGITITLTGVDDGGGAVYQVTQTDAGGIYVFHELQPGTYNIHETQPEYLRDGKDTLGTVNGTVVGSNSTNDVFSDVVLPGPDSLAENYNFGERPLDGGGVVAGQTATIGFWQNRNGQTLLKSLNGGPEASQLSSWLVTTFPNMYGAQAGQNDLTGMTNTEVAAFYSTLFRRKQKEASELGLGGPVHVDVQVLAVAFAVYATNSTLAGSTASAFGFSVTEYGVGIRTFNVGGCGTAFGVEDDSDVAVLDLLLTINSRSANGVLYDLDHDGDADDSLETLLRTMANDVCSAINEQGDT